MSAFLGPDQLATESLLSTDPDVRPWVEKYQRSRETVSQTDYEVITIMKIKLQQYLFLLAFIIYTVPTTRNASQAPH